MQEQQEESMSLLSALYRKHWVDNRERILEIYRTYFHTILVTLLTLFNVLTCYSAAIIYFGQWKHKEGSVESFLTIFFKEPPTFLVKLLSIPYIPLDSHLTFWFIFALNLPIVVWFYSTVTRPIKRGYTTIIDWKGRKGRIINALINGLALFANYCAIFAWYIERNMFHFFAGIQSNKDYLVVKSMSSFGYILMAVPVFICLMGAFYMMKEFHRNEDLRKQFFKWEFGLLASQTFSLRGDKADVIVGWEKATNKPIVLTEEARFLHELVNGATGTGKTSTTILTRIVQDLIRIARGRKLGVCVLEPKGDLIRDVLKLCDKLGIPKHKIKVVDPTDLARSIKFNPFVGPLETAAETFRGVLDALAGDQDEFFKGQQSETASLYTMLGKIRYGNMFSIIHMQRMYSDPRYLADMTDEVRKWINANLELPNQSEENLILLDRYERVCSYFENEVLEFKTYRDKEQRIQPVLYPDGHKYEGKQVVENKKDKFITGAKKYVNDICMNAMLSQLMVADDEDEVLDIDKFLAEGGVLLVNTALGELEELSMSFGQFFIRQFQSSVFRRPSEESGFKRFPIFFNIDEFPLYINEAFVRLLTLGRSYKVGTLIAIQSLGQLESVVKGYDRTIMSNASNKTVFGRGEVSDNKLFSEQFGEEYQVEESMNESVTPISQPNPTLGYRYNTARKLEPRFSPTQIMEQEFKGFIVQLVGEDGAIQEPVQAYGKFISETKFLKRFVKIGQAELQTSKYKDLGSPMKWIQKLAIETTNRLNPLEAIKDRSYSNQPEELPEEVAETSESTQTEQSVPSSQPSDPLPVREDATEVIFEAKQNPLLVAQPPSEQVQTQDEPAQEEPAASMWDIEIPGSPNPADGEFTFYTGYNPESVLSQGEQAVSPISDSGYSEPDSQTGSAIQSLIKEVSNGVNEAAVGTDGSTSSEDKEKPIEKWSLEDLFATDVADSHTDFSQVADAAEKQIEQLPAEEQEQVALPKTNVPAQTQQQAAASQRVSQQLDVDEDDI
ncbi:type IV secretory system conjugative DNA transfer family protein [Paenibacillus sp. Y412MC10]|uniref:type IV secretory system conjugative DNA transfer family protein n=1 Tax=Geobacillus sp. (strain Y412MC10) TaxID=481743 RepID=UPI0011AB5B59|nr:TraM recognition domain-containing protein [Paenibacillus sp. Y412MC10]